MPRPWPLTLQWGPKFGKPLMNPPMAGTLVITRMMTTLSPSPMPPPRAPMVSASARISPITCRLVKPSVFRTAISVRRSRTAMLIVFAVTRRIVKITARPMLLRSRARFPIMARKSARKAASVSLLVSASLFSKIPSMARATVAPCFGSSSSTT